MTNDWRGTTRIAACGHHRSRTVATCSGNRLFLIGYHGGRRRR